VNTDSGSRFIGRRVALAAILGLALLLRANFVFPLYWEQPYDVHHQDEHFLTLEALGLWEGVTPTEIGWPASPLRLLLSAVYGAAMLRDVGGIVLASDTPMPMRMDVVGAWTFERYRDPTQLYVIGRWVSVATGVLQVLLVYWALRRWHSARAGLLAAGMAAISPLAVRYSQFVLADVTGLLFATWLVGLLNTGSAHRRFRPLLAGVVVGAAAASKYHFGLWIVAGVVACLLIGLRKRSAPSGTAWSDVLWFLAGAVLLFLLLVPWIWLNPVLWIKEMIETVLSRAVQPPGNPLSRGLDNLVTTFGGLGTVMFAGVLPGVWFAVRRFGRHAVPMLIVLLAGVLIIAAAGRVFDRWGLFLLPAFVFFAGIGFAELLSHRRRIIQAATAFLIVVVAAHTLHELTKSQRFIGSLDSHGRAHAWLTAHLRPGARVAVHSEYSRRLARTPEQLHTMLEQLSGPKAYERKITSNGFAPAPLEPMRLAVLNMELFWSHWWRRELAAGATDGYEVTFYNDGPRYEGLLTDQVVANFVGGLTNHTDGYEALLLNKNVALPVPPSVVFEGQPGETLYLYLRPPAAGAPSITVQGQSSLH
jgi:hypothetical protein